MVNMNATHAGYAIERVFVASQEYSLVPASAHIDSDENEILNDEIRAVDFGWDWRPLGARRFEVLIDLSVSESRTVPERARVRVVGVFEAKSDAPSIRFRDFAKNNAAAILFPFAREVISSMTGKGLYGAFHVNPINVVALLRDVQFEATSGFDYLRDNEEAKSRFELDVSDESSSSTA